MINNSITFWPKYCIYLSILLSSISLKRKKMEIIFKTKYKNMVLTQFL